MITTSFTKYAGAGNDFIVIDGFKNQINLSPEQMVSFVQRACDRKNIGADGLIILAPSPAAPFQMRFYNPDGSYGALCGNGARCAVQAAKDFGIISEHQTTFEVLEATDSAEILHDEWVKVHFQDPRTIKLDVPIELDQQILTNYVDLGSQHAVTFFEEVQKLGKFAKSTIENFDILSLGAKIRWHQVFAPKGVNANFIEVREDGQGSYLRIRTFERGVEGETLACGTGCMSSAIVAYLQQRIETLPIRLKTQSGEFVSVNFNAENNKITDLTLEGSAKRSFSGVISFNESDGQLLSEVTNV